MYKRMLIATDGSDPSRKAIKHGMTLAEALQVPVTAVFVIDTRGLPGTHPAVPVTEAPFYQSLLEELTKMGESAVGEVAAEGALHGVPVEHRVLEGTPAASILDAAEKCGADLIVMGTHGRTGFARMVLGSTAQQVCHGAKVPVLLVRADDPS